MEEAQHDRTLSRRGVLAATAGVSVGAGLAAVTGAVPAAASPASAGNPQAVAPAVATNFGVWGSVYLAPGQTQDWWFTWIFDANHWSRMSALPVSSSPSGGTVQILAEWTSPGTLWVRFTNNSTVGVIFAPTAIVIG